MIEKTKITLSSKELELVCNTDWILTKQVIIDKVYALFGELVTPRHQSRLANEAMFPSEVIAVSPKISKGENYLGLPYVMLDYPRYFRQDDTVAIRTMFWWGNFFSCTLLLAGKSKDIFSPVLIQKYAVLQQNDYWVCVAEDPWQHHFSTTNYKPVSDYNEDELAAILSGKPFIKIAKKIPLQQWDAAAGFLEQSFNEMITLLRT